MWLVLLRSALCARGGGGRETKQVRRSRYLHRACTVLLTEFWRSRPQYMGRPMVHVQSFGVPSRGNAARRHHRHFIARRLVGDQSAAAISEGLGLRLHTARAKLSTPTTSTAMSRPAPSCTRSASSCASVSEGCARISEPSDAAAAGGVQLAVERERRREVAARRRQVGEGVPRPLARVEALAPAEHPAAVGAAAAVGRRALLRLRRAAAA